MATTGPGLMKLPSMGSRSNLNQMLINSGDASADRRRASITDPCLHAHSVMSLVTPLNSFQSAHEPRTEQGFTLPSFRELRRHSKNSATRLQPNLNPNTTNPTVRPVDDGQSLSSPAAAYRRGSAADLDRILLNPTPGDSPPLAHQPSNRAPTPSNHSSLNLEVSPKNPHQPLGHPSPDPDPDPSSPPLDSRSIPAAHTPISPKSFPSPVPAPSDPEPSPAHIGPAPGRRPSLSAFRRRGSRVNEIDGCAPEEPSKPSVAGSGLVYPFDHARGLPTAGASQWPYPAPHHRHHLHKPPNPVRRRNSSQDIPETAASSPACFGLPSQQGYYQPDHPNHSSRFLSNHPPSDSFNSPTTPTVHAPFDARRQSSTSVASSSGTPWIDRRPSEGSSEGKHLDDDSHSVPGRPIFHRSSSLSFNNPGMLQLSPSDTANMASMNNYAFPPLSYNEHVDPGPNVDMAEGVVGGESGKWPSMKSDSFDEQLLPSRRGSGFSDVHELKDRLAGTRLLDRYPHSNPSERLATAPVVYHANQTARTHGGAPLNPYSRSPELKISHKLAERKRRKEMRELFDELREVLPAADQRHSKGSKWETLSRAVEYMQQIRIENKKLKEENLNLHSQVQSMNDHLKLTEMINNQSRTYSDGGHQR